MSSTPTSTRPTSTRLRSLLSRHDSTERAARRTLARELAEFQSTADLLDLSATLHRHEDADTADIRDLVDWSRAA